MCRSATKSTISIDLTGNIKLNHLSCAVTDQPEHFVRYCAPLGYRKHYLQRLIKRTNHLIARSIRGSNSKQARQLAGRFQIIITVGELFKAI